MFALYASHPQSICSWSTGCARCTSNADFGPRQLRRNLSHATRAETLFGAEPKSAISAQRGFTRVVAGFVASKLNDAATTASSLSFARVLRSVHTIGTETFKCLPRLPITRKAFVRGRPDAYIAKQLMLRRICEVGGKEEAVFSWRHFDYNTKDRKRRQTMK